MAYCENFTYNLLSFRFLRRLGYWWYNRRSRTFIRRADCLSPQIHCLDTQGSPPVGNDELPIKLQEYKDVFEHEKAGILPPHRDIDHAIDTPPGETLPYGPIYPLARNELGVLREYIDENLKLERYDKPYEAPIELERE